MEIGAIILSGGKSSRFGTDKGLVPFKGRPLIDYSLKISKQFAKDIIISANNNEYERFGFPIVPDIVKNAGPMGGIYAALQNSKQELNLILPCDTPYIDKSLIHLLINSYDQEDIVIFQTEDQRYHPLLGLYHKRMLPTLKKSLEKGHYKLIDLILELQYKIIPLKAQDENKKCFLNFNYEKDLKTHEK